MAKVLIIEDEANIANSYAFVLNKEGYETAIASDGQEGIAQAQQLQPDFILLDMLMPGISGLDVLRALNPKVTLPQTKVVVLSNTEAPTVRTQALELGAMAYYLKVELTPHQVVDILKSL